MALTLLDIWPSEANANECLMTEAESASDALFLAVHQPMRIDCSAYGVQGTEESKGEGDLLNAFISTPPLSGTVIFPIVGSSGIGKSHLVRWLDAHLRRRSDAAKRHIVRIPKSASLKRVLELILEDLPNNKYGELRRELTTAVMPPDLLTATRGLQAKLLVQLERKFQEARARLAANTARPDDRQRMAHCAPSSLQALLTDPEINSHFTAYEDAKHMGVLARIASRYVHGAMSSDEGPENVFTQLDLEIPDTINRAHLANQTRQYLSVLASENGRKRLDAVGFLNEVVDASLGELLDFHGTSLADLFVRVRQQFSKDKRELVLLVEDFATLAGIQGSLLDAITRPNRDQEQLCIMRTALAVTTGYLSQWETVTTRAQFEWKLQDVPFKDDDEALDAFTNFVGSYLNASRWGNAVLVQRFAQWEADKERDLQAWIPNFIQEHHRELESEIKLSLEAFGKSTTNNYSLFPFNKAVIHQLGRHYLEKNGRLHFLPRLLLNRILRDTLIKYRMFFEEKQFPPADFHGFHPRKLERAVHAKIEAGGNHDQRDRLAALVYFWGDAPHDVTSAASCSEEIYKTFDLEPVKWGVSGGETTKSQPEKGKPKERDQSPGTKKENTEIDDGLGPWREKLRDWRKEGRISQHDANKLRGFLAEAISADLDWDALLLKPVPIVNKSIWLPKVSIGNPSPQEQIAIAATDQDWEEAKSSTRFFGAIEAVIRYHETHKTWNYPGGDKDSAAYGWLVGKMVSQAETYFLHEGHKIPRASAGQLAQLLLLDARLLNLPGASSNADTELVAAIFRMPLVQASSSFNPSDVWERLLNGARQSRQELLDLLRLHVASRQGGADKVYAVDAALLLDAIRGLRSSSWKWNQDLSLERTTVGHTTKEHLRYLKASLEGAVRFRKEKLIGWRTNAVNWLGEDFDIKIISEELRSAALEARQGNYFSCGDLNCETIRDRIRELESCPLKASLDSVAKMADPKAAFGSILSALAQTEDRVITLLQTVLDEYEQFFRETGKKVDEALANSPPSLQEEASDLKDKLKRLGSHWRDVGTIRERGDKSA
jgi:hypothetical protein